MKKTVNFCGNCPFLSSEYDDFAVGNSTIDKCLLSLYLGQKDYYVSIHNNFGPDTNANTPEWCPLKKESVSFDFNEFSEERLKNIESTKKEIEELEQFFEMSAEEVDYDNPEVIEKSDKIRELYDKLAQLHDNEELSYEERIKNDINDGVEKIKEQLSLLSNVSDKIGEVFNNIIK